MIGSSINRITYNGNGLTTEFAYIFPVLEQTDIKVMTTDSEGKSKVLTKDYYVDIAKGVVIYPGYAPGAEITDSNKPAILPSGSMITLYREIPITQESSLSEKWPFNTIEDGLDKLTMICQQVEDATDRSLKLAESADASIDVTVPVKAGMYFRWNEEGTGLVIAEEPGNVLDETIARCAEATRQAEIATEQANIAIENATTSTTAATNASTSETNAATSAQNAEWRYAQAVQQATMAKEDRELAEAAVAEAKAALVKANLSELPDDVLARAKYTRLGYAAPYLPKVTKTSVTIYAGTCVKINTSYYTLDVDTTLYITQVESTAANRAGKDYYIYACEPPKDSGSVVPTFVLSANSTVPDGYTAETSRKIGGFHCLCKDVGTISGHTLSGYATGDILPMSLWDLYHCPRSDDKEGMVYSETTDTWFDIYLSSWDGSKLVSVYGGACADGTSSKKFHGELYQEELVRIGKRLPWRHEFVPAAYGSNEGTNIYASSDAGTTGGHTDTTSVRMISNIGMEDCCGFMWQWTQNLGFAGGSSWTDSIYNSNVDSIKRGQSYGTLYRLLVGARWHDGSSCGSRSASCDSASSDVHAVIGGRGAVEPRNVRCYAEYVNA